MYIEAIVAVCLKRAQRFREPLDAIRWLDRAAIDSLDRQVDSISVKVDAGPALQLLAVREFRGKALSRKAAAFAPREFGAAGPERIDVEPQLTGTIWGTIRRESGFP